MFTITKEWLEANVYIWPRRWHHDQLALIGVQKTKRGWMDAVIGTFISDETKEKFESYSESNRHAETPKPLEMSPLIYLIGQSIAGMLANPNLRVQEISRDLPDPIVNYVALNAVRIAKNAVAQLKE